MSETHELGEVLPGTDHGDRQRVAAVCTCGFMYVADDEEAAREGLRRHP